MSFNSLNYFRINSTIPGIKDNDDFQAVLKLPVKPVFVLYGDILTIPDIVRKLKEHGKTVFVNIDLIEGFSSKEIVVKFLKTTTQIDGILSSKANMIRAAGNLGLITIHRFFLIDSFSYSNLFKQIEISKPDCIEMMPGCMPTVISWVVEKTDIPVIAGGLVCNADDAQAALNAGACAVSSTNRIVWSWQPAHLTGIRKPNKSRRVILKDLTET